MYDRAKILRMQFVQRALRIREHPIVPHKRSVLRIPSRRAKSRPEINQRIARQFLFAKCLRLAENFFFARQRPMRLLIAKTPQRRHFRMPRQPRIFRQNRRRFLRRYYKNIERQQGVSLLRLKLSSRRRQIERPKWLMEIDRPSARSHQPRNRHATTMSRQAIAALPAHHFVDRPAPIELSSTFTQSEQRRFSRVERNRSVARIDRQRLNNGTRRVSNVHRERADLEAHA